VNEKNPIHIGILLCKGFFLNSTTQIIERGFQSIMNMIELSKPLYETIFKLLKIGLVLGGL